MSILRAGRHMRNQSQPVAPVYLVGYPGSPGYPTIYITLDRTMTVAQHQLVRQWLIAAASLVGIIVAADILAENWLWLRIPVGAVIAIALLTQRRSHAELRAESIARWEAVTDDAPWVKIWLGFWAAFAFGGAIYVTRNSIDVLALLGIRGMFAAFAVLLGPLFVLSEARRFKQLGGKGDAI